MAFSTICVYCGASNLAAQKFKDTAKAVGSELGRRGMWTVYGGGHVGLMGITADAALEAGGKVVGIIPEHIRTQEVQHNRLTELHVVPDMHTRKRMMVARADAFVILPGGFGTLDELFEILTWKKLKLHDKPVIIFNQDGYWDPMIALIQRLIDEKFASAADHDLYSVVTDVAGLFGLLDTLPASRTDANTSRM